MNYNEISKKHDDVEIVDETVESIEEEIPEVATATGVVTAGLLNVRADADSAAEVLGVIKKDSEVMIDLDESTDEFYSVCTESGLYGFCMKEFIEVKD